MRGQLGRMEGKAHWGSNSSSSRKHQRRERLHKSRGFWAFPQGFGDGTLAGAFQQTVPKCPPLCTNSLTVNDPPKLINLPCGTKENGDPIFWVARQRLHPPRTIWVLSLHFAEGYIEISLDGFQFIKQPSAVGL